MEASMLGTDERSARASHRERKRQREDGDEEQPNPWNAHGFYEASAATLLRFVTCVLVVEGGMAIRAA